MWQAARCEERSTQVPSAGILAAHTSSANGQRVRKRQPDGGLIGLGGSPVSGASSMRSSGSMLSRELSSAWV